MILRISALVIWTQLCYNSDSIIVCLCADSTTERSSSIMDHPNQNTMLLPASYAVISEEEMTYLDGGQSIYLSLIHI